MFDLIVLAGGKSRRMGTDKAELVLGGETFLHRILGNFPDAAERILSCGAEDSPGAQTAAKKESAGLSPDPEQAGTCGISGVKTVRDRIPDFGPLGGLEAALPLCTGEYVFVTAVDQPFMEQGFAERLLAWLPENFDAAVPVSRDGRIHPLSALYRTAALRTAVSSQIAEGDHRVRKLLERMRTMYLPAEAVPGGEMCLRNINTPEEYAELCAELPVYERTPSGIPVFALAAWSGTGKTTFLERLIPELKRQRPGLRIGVVKHDVHGFTVDREGKDTRRLQDAGADVTAILNEEHAAVMEHRPRSVYEILEGLSELDLLLLEGFKKEPFRKILLYRKAAGQPPAADPAECFLVVAEEDCGFRADFRPEETEKIAAFLLDRI